MPEPHLRSPTGEAPGSQGVPGHFARALDGLYLGAAWAGAACVLLICMLMLTQAGLRLTGTMVRGADDITAWACAGAAFLPLAATFKRGELVRMGLFIDRLRGTKARWLELVALGLCSSFGAYLTVALCNLVYGSYSFDERGQGLLPIPIWIPQAPVAAGAAILTVALLEEFARVARGLVPSYVQQVRERRASGDYSGEV